MNDIDMEEKLLKSGFTTKEIRKIKYFVKKTAQPMRKF